MPRGSYNAKLNAGVIVGAALGLDLEAIEACLDVNPGPLIYIELERETIRFVRAVRAIMAARGHERLNLPLAGLGEIQ